MKILLYGLLIWFLYNLLFRFIIPVYRTTKEVKGKFRQMQAQQEEQVRRQQQQQNGASGASSSSRPSKPVGDYIDFEEIK